MTTIYYRVPNGINLHEILEKQKEQGVKKGIIYLPGGENILPFAEFAKGSSMKSMPSPHWDKATNMVMNAISDTTTYNWWLATIDDAPKITFKFNKEIDKEIDGEKTITIDKW